MKEDRREKGYEREKEADEKRIIMCLFTSNVVFMPLEARKNEKTKITKFEQRRRKEKKLS